MAPSSDNTVAVVCGPPVMIKFSFPVLEKLEFKDTDIYTTLENRMKCGLGKCGRCNVGKMYVCKDGPVFTGCRQNTDGGAPILPGALCQHRMKPCAMAARGFIVY